MLFTRNQLALANLLVSSFSLMNQIINSNVVGM